MKIGTENRKKVIALAVLAVLALLLGARAMFTSSDSETASAPATPSNAVETPVRPSPRAPARGAKAASRTAAMTQPRLDPTLDLRLLKGSEDTKYAGSGRNIFVSQAEPVIPQPKARGVTDAKNAPPPPPPPPPILLKFYGFASRTGEPKKIFLSQGEDVFIAAEGDIVNRRYRILHINPSSVEVEDVLNNNRQSIPLTQG